VKPGLLLVVLLAGCASTPPATLERVGLETARKPIPECESGHEGALTDGTVTVRPGEIVCFEIAVQGGSVVLTRLVPAANSDNTVIVKAWSEGKDTFIRIQNPLSTFLQYKATLLRPGAPAPEYTSTCQVLSHRFGLEHWPYEVIEFHLSQFTSVPESSGISCQ
jgi:hypothetical protein